MSFRIGCLCVTALLSFFLPATSFSETLELVTYYPSAGGGGGGMPDDLHVRSISVGTGYAAQPPLNGVAIVEERVGIGTPIPQLDLDIYNDDETFVRVTGTGIAGAPENYSGLELAADTDLDGDADLAWQWAHKRGGTGNPDDLHLNYFDGLAWSTLLAVRPTGEVGIGLGGAPPTPGALLDVGGTVNADGNVTMGSNASIAGDLTVTGAVNAQSIINLPNTIDANTGVIYKAGVPFIHNYRPGGIGGTLENNLFIGENAGNFTMGSGGNGQSNIGIGIEALSSNTTGRSNVVIGNRAMRDNLDGAQNVTIGYHARMFSTGGHDSVAIGTLAMSGAVPMQSIALGTAALAGWNPSTPVAINSNIAIGNNALRQYNSSITNNVAVGFGALQGISGGSNNVAIGHRAGQSTSGSGNIFIGFESGRTQNGSDQLMIDNENTATPLIKGDFSNDTLTVNGNLGIGNTSFGGAAARHVLAFGPGTSPSPSVNHAILFSTGGELRVKDASGNTTTLSPHDFSGIPGGPSEPLAWAYHSERDGQSIHVDMLKAVRMLERLTGEQLVYIQGEALPDSGGVAAGFPEGEPLAAQVRALRLENESLKQRLEALEKAAAQGR
ncbi:MAG: hypothetical protein COV76_04480 [Candidatus Omnitrophica bacterium CG11_big_fil_rev_8_21_14_0_20_64_10]|nr:MAG: hypothetical protein COV76_04480 [Candidatus Omnitrophica bacterium CG11_big_fil_rev_8_21_14_0_20_64_10]